MAVAVVHFTAKVRCIVDMYMCGVCLQPSRTSVTVTRMRMASGTTASTVPSGVTRVSDTVAVTTSHTSAAHLRLSPHSHPPHSLASPLPHFIPSR